MRFDHEAIQKSEDRNQASALFAAMVDPDTTEDERDEIVTSLVYIDDPRLSEPLRAIVFDPGRSDEMRLAACDAIERSEHHFTDAERRALWNLGTPALQRRILGSLSDPDIVLPIAADPGHWLHARAIDALSFGFEDQQDLAVAALRHADSDVRFAAVTTLLWEEPVGAVPGLIACLDDVDERVRTEAYDCLQYFRDRRVLSALRHRGGPTFEMLSDDFARELTAQPALEDWLGADLARTVLTAADGERPPSSYVPRKPVQFDVAALCRDLAELDGEWAGRHRYIQSELDWARVEGEQRALLKRSLVDHPDPKVVWALSRALCAWDDHEGLLQLVEAGHSSVAPYAVYQLTRTPPDPAVGERLRVWFTRKGPRFGSAWREAVKALVHHMPREEAITFANEIIAGTRSEGKLSDCVAVLASFHAHDHVSALVPRLLEPPRVTWAFHIALLDAMSALGIDGAELPQLAAIDDLHMASAMVGYAAQSTRHSTN